MRNIKDIQTVGYVKEHEQPQETIISETVGKTLVIDDYDLQFDNLPGEFKAKLTPKGRDKL